jgi:hypothetical protein
MPTSVTGLLTTMVGGKKDGSWRVSPKNTSGVPVCCWAFTFGGQNKAKQHKINIVKTFFTLVVVTKVMKW